jgi:hypothetical protein
VAKVELRVRNLDDGKDGVANFDNLDAARAWLAERPAGIEVQGVVGELEPDDERSLQEAMRPLDAQERGRKDALYQEQLAAVKARNAEEQRRAVAEQQVPRTFAADAPMTIEYVRGQQLRNPHPDDDRPIPEVVRAAVRAWIAERDTWLHPRRQHVASALVEVLPGDVGDGSRVQPGGQFTAAPGIPDDA